MQAVTTVSLDIAKSAALVKKVLANPEPSTHDPRPEASWWPK
jgi:hypothetical protein